MDPKRSILAVIHPQCSACSGPAPCPLPGVLLQELGRAPGPLPASADFNPICFPLPPLRPSSCPHLWPGAAQASSRHQALITTPPGSITLSLRWGHLVLFRRLRNLPKPQSLRYSQDSNPVLIGSYTPGVGTASLGSVLRKAHRLPDPELLVRFHLRCSLHRLRHASQNTMIPNIFT